MSYAKQNFVDGQTLTAAHLNHIEAGIADLEQNTGEKASATDLSTETDRAKKAEKALQDSITAESTRAQTAEKANADAVTAETTRATGEEQRLNEALTAEKTRAQQAETALSGTLDALGLSVVDGALCITYDDGVSTVDIPESEADHV